MTSMELYEAQGKIKNELSTLRYHKAFYDQMPSLFPGARERKKYRTRCDAASDNMFFRAGSKASGRGGAMHSCLQNLLSRSGFVSPALPLNYLA